MSSDRDLYRLTPPTPIQAERLRRQLAEASDAVALRLAELARPASGDVIERIDETLTFYSAGLGEELTVPVERRRIDLTDAEPGAEVLIRGGVWIRLGGGHYSWRPGVDGSVVFRTRDPEGRRLTPVDLVDDGPLELLP